MTPTFPSYTRDADRDPGGTFLTLLLLAVYLFTGLVGHDPWKQDEAYSFGIVYNMSRSGDLVVPMLAADPFMEKPPAYYATAAALVRLLSPMLAPHDAARLASGFYTALTLVFTWLLGRDIWGPGGGRTGAATLVSSLGLLLYAHFMFTDVALLAGMTLGYYGLYRARVRWWSGGLALGTGAGLAFLSKGLLGPGIVGISALALPLLFRAWRSRVYLGALGVAFLAVLPWLSIWPLALYLRSPELFMKWFWDNNFGRYLGTAHLGPRSKPGFWWRNLPWFTFPVLPLALWTLLRRGREAMANPGVQMSLLVSVVIWLVLINASTSRELYALPLLPVLSLLAAGGIASLPGWFIRLVYWSSLTLFGLLALSLWGAWVFMLWTGRPPALAALARLLPMGYEASFRPLAFAYALILSLAWLGGIWCYRPPRTSALLSWVLGLTLVWGLAFTLHLPWIDLAKSYRSVFRSLESALPTDYDCIADIHLRESERGMLHYFSGIATQHVKTAEESGCALLLVETKRKHHPRGMDLGHGWRLIWEGHRPGDRNELFFLMQRRAAASGIPAERSSGQGAGVGKSASR